MRLTSALAVLPVPEPLWSDSCDSAGGPGTRLQPWRQRSGRLYESAQEATQRDKQLVQTPSKHTGNVYMFTGLTMFVCGTPHVLQL